MMQREGDIDAAIESTMEVSEQQASAEMDAGVEPSNEVVDVKDPVEEAAEKFTTLLPYVRKLSDSADSKGSLVRVLHAFAEFPLGKGKPRLFTQKEQLLFNILQELQGYKSTILQDFMKKNLEALQLQKMLEANGGGETKEKGNENNG